LSALQLASAPPANPLDLAGRVALVTGAARGIGRAIATTLAGHGALVVATDLPSAAPLLDALVAEIANRGGLARAVPADISRKAEVDALVQSTMDGSGRIDILVNNAGIHDYPAPLLETSEADWDRLFAVNVKGVLFACQAAVPHMRAQGTGSVINIASDSAFDVIADEGGYGISKIAVVRMAAYLAKELAGTGIRVNSLAPGWVRSRLTEPFFQDPVSAASIFDAVPARRIAEPDEIANVVLFLASDLASYVNGHCIVVDGGRIAGIPA
jgi:NAD(P)-dependent dehydrogenase (short-subunit alcohol dehydrogenase family)